MIEVTLVTAGLLTIVAITTPAQAQQESVAESLFRQAREEMRQGNPRSACPKFEESYRLDPSIGTLLNLGLCEEARGRTATAWTKLRQFLDSAPAGDSRLRLAQQKLNKLETQLPWLRLVVDDQGVEQVLLVQLDGVELRDASLTEAIPVNPGEHSVRISLPTGETNETRFHIDTAEKLQLGLSAPARLRSPAAALAAPARPAMIGPPRPLLAPPSATPTPPTSGRYRERAVAYAIGALGIVGLATGSIFGLMAIRDRRVVRDHCPNHECQDQTSLEAVESGSRNESKAELAFMAGALGLATGGVLLWHSGRANAAVSVRSHGACLSLVGIIE